MPRLNPFLDVATDAIGRAAIAATERAKAVVRQLPQVIEDGAADVVQAQAVPAVNAALGSTVWQGGGLTDGDHGDVVVADGGDTLTLDSALLSAFCRASVLPAADAAGVRTALALGTAALSNTGAFAAAAHAHAIGDITGLNGAWVVSAIDAQLGSTLWQLGGGGGGSGITAAQSMRV